MSLSLRSQVGRVAVAVIAGSTLAMILARAYAMPWSALGISRTAISLAALAIMLSAKRHNVARRAVLAVALETAGGIATFAYVDVPFVTSHSRQIAITVAAVYVRTTGRSIVADLAKLSRRTPATSGQPLTCGPRRAAAP